MINNTLYHYTSVDNFINIVNNNELWLTHYSYVDDTKEIKLGYEIIQSELNKRFPTLTEDKLLNLIFNVQRVMPEQYFFCLCPDNKNAHLWENYAKKYSGVAIGFDAKFLAKYYTHSNIFSARASITPVNYNLEEFKEFIANEICKIKIPAFYVVNSPKTKEQLYKMPYYSETKMIIVNCCVHALLLKDPQYSIENETRLLHDKNMHIPIPTGQRFGKNRAFLKFPKIPIKEVIIGKNTKKKSINIIEKLVSDKQLDMKIIYFDA